MRPNILRLAFFDGSKVILFGDEKLMDNSRKLQQKGIHSYLVTQKHWEDEFKSLVEKAYPDYELREVTTKLEYKSCLLALKPFPKAQDGFHNLLRVRGI
jgi:hypothetical protein